MIEQRTDEWFAERAGHVTGSRIDDVLAEGKKPGTPSVTRRKYMAQLVAERLSNRSLDTGGFVTKPMQRGIDIEPCARAWYFDKTGSLVSQLGFTKHPTLKWVGCSPDGEVEEGVGGVQFKCPDTDTHIDTLLNGRMGYMKQVQLEIWVMGWQWSDFVSFDDRMPEPLQGVIIRCPRDQQFIDDMEIKVKAFLAETDEQVKKLEALCSRP